MKAAMASASSDARGKRSLVSTRSGRGAVTGVAHPGEMVGAMRKFLRFMGVTLTIEILRLKIKWGAVPRCVELSVRNGV